MLLLAGILAEEERRLYSSEFDHLDVDAILADDAERDRYYGCLMDTGPCHSAAAVFFKGELVSIITDDSGESVLTEPTRLH